MRSYSWNIDGNINQGGRQRKFLQSSFDDLPENKSNIDWNTHNYLVYKKLEIISVSGPDPYRFVFPNKYLDPCHDIRVAEPPYFRRFRLRLRLRPFQNKTAPAPASAPAPVDINKDKRTSIRHHNFITTNFCHFLVFLFIFFVVQHKQQIIP